MTGDRNPDNYATECCHCKTMRVYKKTIYLPVKMEDDKTYYEKRWVYECPECFSQGNQTFWPWLREIESSGGTSRDGA